MGSKRVEAVGDRKVINTNYPTWRFAGISDLLSKLVPVRLDAFWEYLNCDEDVCQGRDPSRALEAALGALVGNCLLSADVVSPDQNLPAIGTKKLGSRLIRLEWAFTAGTDREHDLL